MVYVKRVRALRISTWFHKKKNEHHKGVEKILRGMIYWWRLLGSTYIQIPKCSPAVGSMTKQGFTTTARDTIIHTARFV
jgi:hypothetical protein